MDNILPSRLWSKRIIFIVMCIAILFLHLLPLDTTPRRWAPPDLMLALTMAWVLRRPDFAPPLSIAAVFLLADFLLQRPPGLQTLLTVLSAEYLRYRGAALSESGFAGEWILVGLTLTAATLVGWIILAVASVPAVSLSLSLMQLFLSIVIYPLAVLVTEFVFGVRKPAPGDDDTLGARA